MPNILLISGSPTEKSKSTLLLEYASKELTRLGATTTTVSVRDFPAEDLIQAKYDSPAFEPFKASVANADAIIITTPIYKASYTGSLKALLDILPQKALARKTIFPLATGGTIAHLLAIEYALNPVLSVLGAGDILQGVFIVDSQFHYTEESFTLDAEIAQRFDEALKLLSEV